MMNRKITTLGVGLAVAVSTVACDNNNITSVNTNPNSPTSAPATALFTQATVATVGRFLGSGYDLRGTEFLAQHLTEVQYPDEDRYARLTGGSTTGYFDAPYYTELQDYQKAIDAGKRDTNPQIWGPATTMQVWTYSYLTDTWGDIPYSQALKGDSGVLQPVYDKQSDIYASFFARLDSVSNALQGNTNPVKYGKSDPIYGSSSKFPNQALQWQKFTNSLRLRLAMRISYVDQALATAQVNAALNAPGGVFTSNADNALLAWPGDGVYDNPWAANFKTRDDHRLSDRLTSIMNAQNDPRLPVYAQPAEASGTYAGAPNGHVASFEAAYLTTASRPGTFIMPGGNAYGAPPGTGQSYPSIIMTYAEVQFLLAEAAERGMIAGSAATYYAQAITASMHQWNVPNADAAAVTYLAQGPNAAAGDTLGVAYQGGVNGLKQIAVQKWISLFTDGGTAWDSYRRTCYPSWLHVGPDAVAEAGGLIPSRLQYSITEASVNKDNLDAAIARQGPDKFTTHVWWDTKASPTCQ